MRGFILLLMRHRHGEKWTIEERITMTKDLRAIPHLSPLFAAGFTAWGLFIIAHACVVAE